MKRFGPSPLYIIPSVVIWAVVLFLNLAFLQKGRVWGVGFFVLFLAPITVLLLFVNFRYLILKEDSLCFRTILGTRCIPLDEIEGVELKRLGIRKVIWVRARDGVIISPLIFGNLEALKTALSERLGDRCQREGWDRSMGDALLLYLTALFLLTIVASKLILG